MEIKELREGKKLSILVIGRIDTTTAPELETYITEALEGIEAVEFNFSQVEYISSAGLRVLLEAQKKITLIDGSLNIVNVSDAVMEIFEATGFTDIIDISK